MNRPQHQALEERIGKRAVKFTFEHGLLPSRKEVGRKINEAAVMLKQAAGVESRFE